MPPAERRTRVIRIRPLRAVVALLVAGVAVCLALLNGCSTPLRVDPLVDRTPEATVDDRLELARRYAPWVLKEMHPTKGRQDVCAPVDFDGDFDGENNWETYSTHRLVPTVYYAVLESETHWFIAYHLFHPRDWTTFDLGVHLTHENDGENLQVVVEKESDRVVLLYAQAHYDGRAYADGAKIRGGAYPLCGDVFVVDDDGRPNGDGRHACVFVEWGGHGIYGVTDADAKARIDASGAVTFDEHGRVFRPAADGEPVEEPEPSANGPVAYRLESTTAKLWPLLRDGSLVGEGRLLDGAVRLETPETVIDVPRYYEADRYSGPLGPDRGISPFALDFTFDPGRVGALFFDPARRYAECLAIQGVWSTRYVDNPFATR